jgi:hypothetical protein
MFRLSLILVGAGVAVAFSSAAYAVAFDSIPDLASKDFGWQSNLEDWQDPPQGAAHGPMREDPAYPFNSNAQAARTGTQPNNRITNSKDPILKPWVAAEIQATNDEVLEGRVQVPFTSQSRCYPGSVPGQLLYPFEPFYAVQTPKAVWLIWQRDHMVRRIFLTDKHSSNLKPQSFGESIGHYEGDNTLVVDTIGLATKNNYIDNFRTPHTEKEHVVERLTISPDGKQLTALVTVDDPDTFNEPIHMKQTWHKVVNPLLETVCAENNNDSIFFHQKLFPMPEAAKPDF